MRGARVTFAGFVAFFGAAAACTSFGDSVPGATPAEAGLPDAASEAEPPPCATCGERVIDQITAPTRIGVEAGKLVYIDGTAGAFFCDVAACPGNVRTVLVGKGKKRSIAIGGGVVGITEGDCTGATVTAQWLTSLDGTVIATRDAICARAVTATKSAIYFTSEGSPVNFGGWSIARCDGAGCVELVGSATRLGLGNPLLSVVSSGSIYSATDESHVVRYVDGPSADAGALENVATGAFLDLATDGASLFWLEANAGVLGCTLASCTATRTVIRDDTTANAIVADATGAYWTSPGSGDTDGKVMRLAPGGTTPVAIATTQRHPQAIALDDGFVYWSNAACERCADGQGEIRRIAKPAP